MPVAGARSRPRSAATRSLRCAIDYKAGDIAPALAAACPDGVDVYFDNTAGAISDAVLAGLRSAHRS